MTGYIHENSESITDFKFDLILRFYWIAFKYFWVELKCKDNGIIDMLICVAETSIALFSSFWS